ncbi:MAG: 2-oxo acid dehydrogenase subunit E2 [Hyphomicrobiaceae bacterium]|nr:2-oxo acid dehydrogenase subunit E2 [Hyphomicrobiaceae bacterium]
MFSGDRADGKRVRNVSTTRLLMPYILPRRGDAVTYLKQKIDVTETQAYLKRWNDGTRPKLRIMHVYLAAYARMFGERPHANRFIAGRRLYQRNDVAISMAVLKSRGDEGHVSTVKQTYEPTDGLTKTRARVMEIVTLGRGSDKTAAEQEMDILLKLPRFLIPFVLWLQKVGDWLNLTPSIFARNDPLYASMMVAFNGTVGLDSVYHHLFEHGTIPIVSVIGPIRDEVVVNKNREMEVRPIVTIRYATDERMIEGHYAATGFDLFKKYVENPWLLETPDDNGPGAPAS